MATAVENLVWSMDLARLPLCSRDEIPENGTREFVFDNFTPPYSLFVVRNKDAIHAYENRCPHTGVELNWQPNVFLDAELKHIQCGTHGALFRIEDGFCIYGPCAGASLTPIRLHIHKEMLYADANPRSI